MLPNRKSRRHSLAFCLSWPYFKALPVTQRKPFCKPFRILKGVGISLFIFFKALWRKCIMQYLASSPQVNEQSQSKSASGTTCKNPETKRAMELDLSQRKIWAIHLRCLCLGNLWKNVCCFILQTMEILDKEKNRHCQESSTHPFQILKHGDVILWK